MTNSLVPPGARIEGGDLVLDSATAEFVGFMADPDRVLLRFEGFDVAIPDDAAWQLLRQMQAKMRSGQ